MNARRFNERLDAAVRAQALDIEAVLRLAELEAAMSERLARLPEPEPVPEQPAREVAA